MQINPEYPLWQMWAYSFHAKLLIRRQVKHGYEQSIIAISVSRRLGACT